MTASTMTRDHETIKDWVEHRGGNPAKVATDASGGILRIDFGEPDDGLEQIEWDEFFKIFDSNGLRFLFQDETTEGGLSRFNKFVDATDAV